MKKILVLFCLLATMQGALSAAIDDLNLSSIIASKKLSKENFFRSDDYYNWCNSIIKGEDGKYHLFYSRWQRKRHFCAWLTHSTVAHAVADSPAGPYRYVETCLDFDSPKGYKKGARISAHNPKIKFFNGKYYLYFISTYWNEDLTEQELLEVAKVGYSHKKWMPLRNNQRTYVAVSKSLNGPWKIKKKSLLEPSGVISNVVVNPAIDQGEDGKFYMIVKGDKPNCKRFIRNQAVAISNKPDKGFVLSDKPVIDKWDTEDISMWFDKVRKRFYAVFHAHTYIGMMTSSDGVNWVKATDFSLTKKILKKEDGTIVKVGRMERPFVFVENNVPQVLSLAIGNKGDTYIVFIPLK